MILNRRANPFHDCKQEEYRGTYHQLFGGYESQCLGVTVRALTPTDWGFQRSRRLQQRDRAATQTLLARHVLIHRDQYFKAGLFGGGQKFTVSQTGEPGVPAGLALVTNEVMTESLVYAFVQEKTHSTADEQGFFRLFQSLQGMLPADGVEPLQKPVKAVSGLKVFEECTHQDSCASKRGRTGHNSGIANDDGFHVFIVPQ